MKHKQEYALGRVIQMPKHTYTAKLFEVAYDNKSLKVAGTLDGFIDLAMPSGTYQLNLDEARLLAVALNRAVDDVKVNCMYERDALLCSNM